MAIFFPETVLNIELTMLRAKRAFCQSFIKMTWCQYSATWEGRKILDDPCVMIPLRDVHRHCRRRRHACAHTTAAHIAAAYTNAQSQRTSRHSRTPATHVHPHSHTRTHARHLWEAEGTAEVDEVEDVLLEA